MHRITVGFQQKIAGADGRNAEVHIELTAQQVAEIQAARGRVTDDVPKERIVPYLRMEEVADQAHVSERTEKQGEAS